MADIVVTALDGVQPVYENAFGRLLMNMTLSTGNTSIFLGIHYILMATDLDIDDFIDLAIFATIYVSLFAQAPMLITTLLYSIFGKILGIVEGKLVIALITYYLPFGTLISNIGLIIAAWAWISTHTYFFVNILILVGSLAGAYFLQLGQLRLSVDAIRTIDPTWDKMAPGEYMWMNFMYWFGIKERGVVEIDT